MLYFKCTIITMITHLPLNCIAFSVSKSPLPSTYDPTSSSFLYTWIFKWWRWSWFWSGRWSWSNWWAAQHNQDDLAVRANWERCCCWNSGVAFCLNCRILILNWICGEYTQVNVVKKCHKRTRVMIWTQCPPFQSSNLAPPLVGNSQCLVKGPATFFLKLIF